MISPLTMALIVRTIVLFCQGRAGIGAARIRLASLAPFLTRLPRSPRPRCHAAELWLGSCVPIAARARGGRRERPGAAVRPPARARAAAAAADRARAVGRRRARRRAYRRDQGAPRAARADRRDRGHEHRRDRRRLLRVRHDRAGHAEPRREPRVGRRVPERHAAQAQVVSPQARRLHVPRQSEAGSERRPVPVARGPRAGPGLRHGDLARDAARVASEELRRSRGAVPRGRDGPRDRQARRARVGRSRALAAREHVDPRRADAGRDRRPPARRRRRVDEPADRGRAEDGRGRDHRGRRHFAAADARDVEVGGRRHDAAHEPARPREPRRGAQEARTERRADRAVVRCRTSARSTSRACARRSKPATTP